MIMIKALAINAISITVFYLCGIIGMITGIDGATLHTMPMLQFTVYGSLSISVLSTLTAGALVVARAAARLIRRSDAPRETSP
jgi:hypothetical protein